MKIIFNRKNKMIYKYFILSHIIAYAFLIIIPAKAIEPNTVFLFLINSIFLSLVVSSSLLLFLGYPKVKSRKNNNNFEMTQKQLIFNVKIVSYGSVIGLLLILYDRVFIRGIDYTKGLRLARYTWLQYTGCYLPSII